MTATPLFVFPPMPAQTRRDDGLRLLSLGNIIFLPLNI